MKTCKYRCCNEPAVVKQRCRKHHAKYIAMRDSSRAQPKCAECRCCLPLGWSQRLCLNCAKPTLEMHVTISFYIPKD